MKRSSGKKKLLKIIGIILIAMGALMLVLSMIFPFEVTLNDYTTKGRLFELASEPGPFFFLLGMCLGMIVVGGAGLFISKRMR